MRKILFKCIQNFSSLLLSDEFFLKCRKCITWVQQIQLLGSIDKKLPKIKFKGWKRKNKMKVIINANSEGIFSNENKILEFQAQSK